MKEYKFLLIILIIIILLFFIVNIFLTKNKKDCKICCFYAYYEKNDLYKKNFEYFLDNGIVKNVDYYIILNGECTVPIIDMPNITIIHRENKGYDFGAYSYAIKQLKSKYDYYFFINTSVRGPYLDKYKNSKNWTECFIDLFNKKDIKLVGTSINIYPFNIFEDYNLKTIYKKNKPFTHIQSMVFCIDNEYFEFLKTHNFFNEDELNNCNNIEYVIAYKEFGLTQLALMNGWNINSILPKYKNIDYRKIKKDFNKSSLNGDPYFKNAYFGKTIDKYDAIFLKTNRINLS
jgi:hypothetical protein